MCGFFLHDNSKRNRSRNTKLEYIVVYENSLDEFDIELPISEASTPFGKETDLLIPSNCSDFQSISTGNHAHNNYQQLTQPLVIRNVEETPFHFQY